MPRRRTPSVMYAACLVSAVLLVLALSACDSEDQESGYRAATATTDIPGTTGAPLTTAAATAPDFALALGDGGTFRLRDEQKPVYLVFWAEW